ncbi:hypothetical protein [Methanimicrococcus hacksteinii]|uniref:hypothetical protein n=1 Tax=Methanimicrococcus hacksteinii TaxID=3028293 RepID=UPI00298F391E|nr:hypothetical protein [Methanimicrococcus sp. At1]
MSIDLLLLAACQYYCRPMLMPVSYRLVTVLPLGCCAYVSSHSYHIRSLRERGHRLPYCLRSAVTLLSAPLLPYCLRSTVTLLFAAAVCCCRLLLLPLRSSRTAFQKINRKGTLVF